jgi:hypothetical protein
MFESGIINSKTCDEVLMGLSQKKKHGTLEVTIDSQIISLRFFSGRITEVREDDFPMAHSVAQMLKEAEVISSLPEGREFETFNELELYLHETGARFNREGLRNTAKHFMLEVLYGMDLDKGGYFTFRAEMVNVEKDYIPTISVGQFLLDRVAIYSEEEQFFTLFPPQCIIHLAGMQPDSLIPEESRVVWILNAKGPQELQRLKVLSLLSEYAYQEMLLKLYREGTIEVTFPQSESTPEFPDDDEVFIPESLPEEYETVEEEIIHNPIVEDELEHFAYSHAGAESFAQVDDFEEEETDGIVSTEPIFAVEEFIEESKEPEQFEEQILKEQFVAIDSPEPEVLDFLEVQKDFPLELEEKAESRTIRATLLQARELLDFTSFIGRFRRPPQTEDTEEKHGEEQVVSELLNTEEEFTEKSEAFEELEKQPVEEVLSLSDSLEPDSKVYDSPLGNSKVRLSLVDDRPKSSTQSLLKTRHAFVFPSSLEGLKQIPVTKWLVQVIASILVIGVWLSPFILWRESFALFSEL